MKRIYLLELLIHAIGLCKSQGILGGLGATLADASRSGYEKREPGNMFFDENEDPSSRIITQDRVCFAPIFSDSLIDKFWMEYRAFPLKGSSIMPYSTKPMIQSTSLGETYLLLFKRIFGDSFELIKPEKSLITDTLINIRTAHIHYKAISEKARGLLDLSLRINSDSSLTLSNISFTPFDNSPNAFIYNLCRNDLDLIDSGQTSILLDSIYSTANDRLKKLSRGAVSKRLNRLTLASFTLLTSRLIIRDDTIWAGAVFSTNKNANLILSYRLSNKKFRLTTIESLSQSQ